jgi:hypothetical protein
VGEVDQLDDPVDERVSERDERIDRAVRDPDQRDFEEAVRRVDRVLDQPEADERREHDAHDGGDDLAEPAGDARTRVEMRFQQSPQAEVMTETRGPVKTALSFP